MDAIEYATDRGKRDGVNAAGWYLQDVFQQAHSDAMPAQARTILRGIEDGDSAVSDGFPFADLSGEFADTLTGPILTEDALVASGMTRAQIIAMDDYGETLTAVCEAYETAYSQAVQDTIETAARSILATV